MNGLGKRPPFLRGLKNLSTVASFLLALSPEVLAADPETPANVDNTGTTAVTKDFTGDGNNISIKTTSTGSTTVTWAGTMTGGSIETSGTGGNTVTFSSGGLSGVSISASSGANTITLESGATTLSTTTITASGGNNTLTDSRTSPTAGTITSVTASGGSNTLNNLKSVTVSSIESSGGNNTLTLGSSSSITGDISSSGGKNAITLNEDSKINGSSISVTASGGSNEVTLNGSSSLLSVNSITASSGSNTITDSRTTASTAGTISNVSASGGTNTISNLQNTTISTVTASGGTNTIVLGTSSSISGDVTSSGGMNTITLDKDSKINGSSISVTASGGSNSITLKDSSALTLGTISADGGSNTVTDSRTTTSAGTITSVTAKNGTNTLSNLQNTTITTVSAEGGTNAITLGASSSITGNITASSGTNTITLNDSAKISSDTISVTASGGTNSITLSGSSSSLTVKDITASSGSNTVTDSRSTASTAGKITSVSATASGASNTLTNLKNTSIGTISSSNSGKNAITLGASSNITGNVTTTNGTNTITLNNTAKFSGSNISVTASGGSNTITGSTSDGGTIASLTATGGTNSITLAKLEIKEIKSSSSGTNTVNLTSSGDIGNIIADGGTNNITLAGTTSITGYVLAKNKGANTVTLNGSSKFNPGSSTQTATEGSATGSILATGNNSTNTITGSTADAGSLKGGITADSSGTNSVTLNKLTINGDITASNGGKNTVTLKTGGSSKNITATGSNSKNTVTMTNATINGNVTSSSSGTNEVTISGSGDRIKGYISADKGSNTVTLSNGAKVTGYVLAKNSGTNTITLNGNSGFNQTTGGTNVTVTESGVTGSILATGTGSSNSITASNDSTDSGTLAGNIVAADSGTNTISVKKLNVNGDVLAQNKGTNTVTLSLGGYVNKVTATGSESKNALTIGGTAQVKGDITAESGGENTVTASGTSAINGKIIATGSSSKNTVTLSNTVTATGDIIAELGGENTLTLKGSASITGNVIASGSSASITGSTATGKGTGGTNTLTLSNSSTITGNIVASGTGDSKNTTGSATGAAKNTITMNGSSKITGNVIANGAGGTTSTNNATNTLTMNGSSSLTGYVSASGGYATNTITLSSTASIALTKGDNDTALYANGENSSNTITDSGTGAHTITGNIVAQNSGTNTLTLNVLTQTGDIKAESKGKNTIKISSSDKDVTSTITGNITATGEGGSAINTTDTTNTMVFYNTSIIGNMTATSAGYNDLGLYGGTSQGTFSATSYGSNKIAMGDTTHRTTLTGEINSSDNGQNTITLTNTEISGGIIANENGTNDITIDALESSNSSSNITANANGKNTVTFKADTSNTSSDLGLIGNILANTSGENTISDSSDTIKSTLTGNVTATGSGAKNTMTVKNMVVSEYILAEDGGANTISEISTRLFTPKISALTTGSNTITITGGELEVYLLMAQGTTAKNTLTLNTGGTGSHINFHYENSSDSDTEATTASEMKTQEEERTVILAQSATATNTASDSSSGTTANVITGNIRALDSGKNTLTLKYVTQKGKIVAQNAGENTITFGNSTTKSTMTEAHTISRIGTNTLNLTNVTFQGSLQALLTDSTNTVTLDSTSTFNGYLVAITDTAEDLGLEDTITATPSKDTATNTLTLNGTGITVNLTGTQVRDAAYNTRGTGNDAIYTEGAKAKNDIQNSGNDATWIIKGNITAFNEGTNTYDFKKKLTMTGSLHAENNKTNKTSITSNTITMNNDSTMSDGYILAKGANTANTLTLNNTSKLYSSYVQADASGGSSAKNTITLKDTSTMALTANSSGDAVSANASGGNNNISGETTGTNTITGNVTATNAGANTINLKILNIKGNITASNAGNNTITISTGTSTVTGTTISASSSSAKNTLSLKNTTLTYTQLLASSSGTNTITMTDTSSFSITNANKTAVSADGSSSANTVTGIIGTIQGNVKASNSGVNTITTSQTLSVSKGYVSATGTNATNTLKASTVLTVDISGTNNNTHAILADSTGAKNTITTTTFSSGDNTISGNITARSKGVNTVTLGKLTMTGSVIAQNAGTNTINIGKKADNQTSDSGTPVLPTTQDPTDGGSFTGGIYALSEGSENTVYFNSQSLLTLSADTTYGGTKTDSDTTTEGNLTALPESFSYAILSDGKQTKNTLVGYSKDGSKLTGDIGAKNSGSNSIYLTNLSISGASITAENQAYNTIVITKASTLDFGVMSAVGSDSTNTLITSEFTSTTTSTTKNDGVGTLSGLMWADDSGTNDLRVRLTDTTQTVKVDVTTLTLGTNTLVVQNVSKATSIIRYIDGNTKMLFAGSNTADNVAEADIKTADTYYDGIYLIPDAEEANSMLESFRSYSGLEENSATFTMTDKNTFSFGGVYIGRITFLDSNNTNSDSTTATNTQSPNVTIEKNSALAARISYSNTGYMNLKLESGARWIVLPNSISTYEVKTLEGGDDITYDKGTASSSTFINPNTIVDIATGGVNTSQTITKSANYANQDSYTRFNVTTAKNLSNVIFRLFTNTVESKTDLITIKGSDSSKPTTDARLQVYYSKDSLKNAVAYNSGTDKIKVATVSATAKSSFTFSTESTEVKQGYVIVNTDFEKKTETVSGKQVDNYYIKSYFSYIDPTEANQTYSVLGINYLVYLTGTNNINKRLGERREKDRPDSFWIRTYSGNITQNYGSEVSDIYAATQGGYDYGIRTKNAMHYIGIAGSYGMNWITAAKGEMDSQMFSGAIYYSYVRDSGLYVDNVLKYDYIDTDPRQLYDFTKNIRSSAISLTEEVGYRVYMANKRIYMDMGIEGIVGYLQGFTALQDNGSSQLSSTVDNFFALRGRAYLEFAYSLKTATTQTDFRVGGSYVADYATMKLDILSVDDGGTASFKTPYNQMAMVNAGINTKLTDRFRIYLEGEMGFLGTSIRQIWAANLGFQFAFGTTRPTDYTNFDDDDDKAMRTKVINAPKIRCVSCSPESGIYLELITLARRHAGLDNYLKQRSDNYRVYQEEKQVTYYIGPFRSVEEAQTQVASISKLNQALTKNPGAKVDVIKIYNKSRS